MDNKDQHSLSQSGKYQFYFQNIKKTKKKTTTSLSQSNLRGKIKTPLLLCECRSRSILLCETFNSSGACVFVFVARNIFTSVHLTCSSPLAYW